MIQANHLLAGLPQKGHEEQVYHPDLEECLVEMFFLGSLSSSSQKGATLSWDLDLLESLDLALDRDSGR